MKTYYHHPLLHRLRCSLRRKPKTVEPIIVDAARLGGGEDCEAFCRWLRSRQ